MSNNESFKTIVIPGQGESRIPSDINLVCPAENKIDISLMHFLVSIPWEEKYLEGIPADFIDFYKFVLPHLHARTTDVHVAKCLGFFNEFLRSYPNVNRRVVGISLILHDSGWSKLTDEEIAESLGVKGLKLSAIAIGPKEKHALEGEKIAKEVLSRYMFAPPLTGDEKNLIYKAILFHDKPEEVAVGGNIPDEVKLLVDLDHLWSFTHENFWQDTIRKGVAPLEYLDNLAKDLDDYFVTNVGKEKASELLEDRREEVDELLEK